MKKAIIILALIIIGLIIIIVLIYKGKNNQDIKPLEDENKRLERVNDSLKKSSEKLIAEAAKYDNIIEQLENKRIKDSTENVKQKKRISDLVGKFKNASEPVRDSLINAFIFANQQPYKR